MREEDVKVKTKTTQELIESAYRGDRRKVRALIESGAPVNETGFLPSDATGARRIWGRVTPLDAAIVSPHINRKVIDILIRAGTMQEETSGCSALHLAVMINATDHALHLLDQGFNPWNPEQHIFQRAEDPRVVRRLLASNPPHEALLDGMLSHGRGCAWKIAAFIRAGADPNHRFEDGSTLLHRAHCAYTIRALVAAGADIDAIHEGEWYRQMVTTPLLAMLHAGGYPSYEGALELIRLGADVNPGKGVGESILLAAVGCREPADKVIEAILRAGADPLVTREGNNALHVFAHGSYEYAGGLKSIFLALVQAGLPLNGRNEKGSTPLLEALCTGNSTVARILIEGGADPNLPLAHDLNDQFLAGMTPLMAAIRAPEVVQLLLDIGADRRATDSTGRTALDYTQEELRHLEAPGPPVHPDHHLYYPDHGCPVDKELLKAFGADSEEITFAQIEATREEAKEAIRRSITLLNAEGT